MALDRRVVSSKPLPLASCTQKLSSAIPLRMVVIFASTTLAPAEAKAPAILEKSPGWSAVYTITSVIPRSESINVFMVSSALS